MSSSSGTRSGARPDTVTKTFRRRAILPAAMRRAPCYGSRPHLLASALLLLRRGGERHDARPLPALNDSVLADIGSATSLLVVSPHPDDETLCCGGVIQRVVRAGGRATVVWLTSGDAARIDLILTGHSLFPGAAVARELGAQRMGEARAATARLGVAAAQQLFLGYPDGGLQELLGPHRTTPYTSPTTGAAVVPYPTALYPGHAYTGESLERDFVAVLERVLQPTLILAPDPARQSPRSPRRRPCSRRALSRAPRASAAGALLDRARGRGLAEPAGSSSPACHSPPPRSPLRSRPWGSRSEPAEEDAKLVALRAPIRRRCASWRRSSSRSCAATSCSPCARTSIRGRCRHAEAHRVVREVSSGTSWAVPAVDVSIDRAGDVLAQPVEPGSLAPEVTTDAT